MYGHVDEFLYTYVAGIQQAAPGWDSIVIAPALLPGLEWVNSPFESPRGSVRVAWTFDAASSAVSLAVAVPPGVRGELVLPRSGRRVALVGGEELRVQEV